MTDTQKIDRLWEEWCDEEKLSGVVVMTNKEIFADILNEMKLAFYAGFYAKIKYTADEQLQK